MVSDPHMRFQSYDKRDNSGEEGKEITPKTVRCPNKIHFHRPVLKFRTVTNVIRSGAN